MIILSPSSRSLSCLRQASSALPMEVPPNQGGRAPRLGSMKGGAQRKAEVSVVSGTQCSTALPKKLRAKASPSR